MTGPVELIAAPGPRRRPSRVYVLREYVGGRAVGGATTTDLYPMMGRHRADIEACIPALAAELQAYEAEVARSRRSLVDWFHEFCAAYAEGASVPVCKRGSEWELAPRTVRSAWSYRMWAVSGLIDAGARGATQGDLKDLMGSGSNGPTGALSVLHAAGLIARLEERR